MIRLNDAHDNAIDDKAVLEKIAPMNLNDTIIVIPSKREPPIQTLYSFPTDREIMLISDPSMLHKHREWVKGEGFNNVMVCRGSVGMIPQSAECYVQAWQAGFKYYFRMDDDLHEKMFVHKDGHICLLEEAMQTARHCASVTGLSLCGFQNTSVRYYMGEGYKRSYGLIHGGAHLARACSDRWKYLDPSLPAYEDVYRSAAHREQDGAVGRVAFIGLDKRSTLRESSMSKTPEVIAKAKEIILSRFPDSVTCDGERVLDDGRQVIPNWRLVRGSTWKP